MSVSSQCPSALLWNLSHYLRPSLPPPQMVSAEAETVPQGPLHPGL